MTKGTMRRRWLLIAVILTAPSGCDNVTWGGTDVRMKAPPPPVESAPVAEAEAVLEPALPELPVGPLLLAGRRSGDNATLVVVGDIQGNGLGVLPSEDEAPGFRDHLTRERLAVGQEIALFSGGTRVGRMTIAETGVDESFCVPRPTVSGTVELRPGASAARRVMGITAPEAMLRPFESFRIYERDYDQGVASLSLASAAIPQVSASWPPSLLESRADIQAFRLPEAEGPSVSATFLVQDRLEISEPGPGGYALFVMGSQRGAQYRSDYVWYRRASRDGKGAPRYFDHLDWNGDGVSEVLLEVFGSGSRWFAALAQSDGRWDRSFQDPCGSPTG